MQLIQRLEEIRLIMEYSIPRTKYGYWITDTGEVIAVDTPQAHVKAIQVHFNNKDLSIAEAYVKALDAGWIRVAKTRTTMDVEAKKPTTAALAILKQIAKEYDEDTPTSSIFDKFYVAKSATGLTFYQGRKVMRDAKIKHHQAVANFFTSYY
jgi:hypothetical protein